VHAYDRVVANHHGALLAHVQRTPGTRAHDLIIAVTARTADLDPVDCSVTSPLRPQERFVQQSDGRGGGRRPSLPAGQPPGTGRGLGLPTANARPRRSGRRRSAVDVAAEARQARCGGVAEAGQGEQVLDAGQQRVVVVRRGAVPAGAGVAGQDQGSDSSTT